MDTDKCKALIRTLELGSLSAAADDLGYTPSGISRMMASLETELGFPLLVRSRSGISATAECETMLPYLRELAANSDLAMRAAGSISGVETGEVRAGIQYPSFYKPLAELIASFTVRYPGVRVDITEGTSTDLAAMTDKSQLDFCIISERAGDHDWRLITEDPMVLLVPSDHHLAKAAAATVADIKREPFIRMFPGEETDSSAYLLENKIEPDVRFSCHNMYAAYRMVGAGLGVTLDNSIFASEYRPLFGDSVCIVPLETPAIIPIGIATPRRGILSPAARRFTEMADGILY